MRIRRVGLGVEEEDKVGLSHLVVVVGLVLVLGLEEGGCRERMYIWIGMRGF